MVDYTTLDVIKSYIQVESTVDDTVLSRLITSVSREIEDITMRRFYERQETRLFSSSHIANGGDVNHRTNTLYLDDDLLGINSITNAQGENIPISSVLLLPINESPKYAIQISRASALDWDYASDEPTASIAIDGTWGYNTGTIPPSNVEEACIRGVQWRYALRDAPFESRGLPDDNIVDVPSRLPSDIGRLLAKFIRYRVSAIQRTGSW